MRRGRGVDFEHRYKTSRWAEDRAVEAFRRSGLIALRLGVSGFSADNLVSTTRGDAKVPDLLVLNPADLTDRQIQALAKVDNDVREIAPSLVAGDSPLEFVLKKALCAIEIEFSPYRAAEMKDREWKVRTKEALDRRPRKHAKPPVAPNIFVKEEDMEPLSDWSESSGVPIVVMHVFDQEAFAIPLSEVAHVRRKLKTASRSEGVRIQLSSGIFLKEQSYDRVDAQGARESKLVFLVTPAASTRVGAVEDVKVRAQLGTSSSKKYVANVLFEGGKIALDEEFLALVRGARV